MKNIKLLLGSVLIIFALILSSCGSGQNPTGLITPSKYCDQSIIFDTQIKFLFPNTGPLSIGTTGSGIEIQTEFPGVEINSHIGPPEPFEGFTCLTLKVINQEYIGETKQIAVYFQDGYELRVKISSESTTEFVFSSGQLAISPGDEDQNYMTYNYLTNTLIFDARGRYFEYFIESTDKTQAGQKIGLCSRVLEENGHGGFLDIGHMISAWIHDFTNKLREDFLLIGSSLGTIWFWVSLLLLIGTSLGIGWFWLKKEKWYRVLFFWFFIPILTIIIYMRVLYYYPNCPII